MTIPVGLGSLLCFILPPHILKAEGQGLFNMYLEFLIRRSRSKLIVFLRNSTLASTAIFSVLHSIIMFGFLKNCTKNFWFTSICIKPVSEDDGQNRCKRIHEKLTCREYLQQVKNLYILWNSWVYWFYLRRIGIEENSKICILSQHV